MGNNTEVARAALLGLADTELKYTALAMLYEGRHGAELRNFATLMPWLEQSGSLCLGTNQVCCSLTEMLAPR